MEELYWISPSRTRQMATPTRSRCYLAVTELDDAWDVAEDEWNLLVQRARGEVKKAARGRLQARPSEGSPGLACLAARLDAPAAKIATPAGFRAEDDTPCRSRSPSTRARAAPSAASGARSGGARGAATHAPARRAPRRGRGAPRPLGAGDVCSAFFVVLLSLVSFVSCTCAVRRF